MAVLGEGKYRLSSQEGPKISGEPLWETRLKCSKCPEASDLKAIGGFSKSDCLWISLGCMRVTSGFQDSQRGFHGLQVRKLPEFKHSRSALIFQHICHVSLLTSHSWYASNKGEDGSIIQALW